MLERIQNALRGLFGAAPPASSAAQSDAAWAFVGRVMRDHHFTPGAQEWLRANVNLEVDDLGTATEESVDYPDYARKVAKQVADGHVDQGLLICGSGTGMAITANKVPGVRAAVAWSEETARLARQHNDANVLAIGARTTPSEQIPAIVRAWFSTDFEGGRHADRVKKIEQ